MARGGSRDRAGVGANGRADAGGKGLGLPPDFAPLTPHIYTFSRAPLLVLVFSVPSCGSPLVLAKSTNPNPWIWGSYVLQLVVFRHRAWDRNLLRDSIHSSIEEQVVMFLHIVGHNQRFRVIHQNWRRSIETVSRYFKEVLYAIGEIRNDMIKPPSSETPLKITNSTRWYPYFKDCVGAIDGTHIHAKVRKDMQAAFRGRKHYTTQNVLAAVDFDLKFTYVLAGWEGSTHDAVILADALERHDGLRVPEGKFYLVDAGYTCCPGFLPPYRGARYHLKEYGLRNQPTNPRELFNLRHSSLCVTVERAFGALKNHFRIIDNKQFHPFKTQVKLVLACCILHNWILGHGVDEVVPHESDWVPNSSPSNGHGIQVDDSAAWAAIRDEWANSMWANRGHAHI